MSADYSIIEPDLNWDFCTLGKVPKELQELMHMPAYGERMGRLYPGPLVYAMSARFPGKAVPDFVRNTPCYLIVSDRLRQLLDQHVPAEKEMLPLLISDHKGRTLPESYFIVNLLGRVDCVDLARSQYTLDPMSDTGEFQFIQQLTLDISRIPTESNLFRIQHHPTTYIIRKDLAALLEQHGMTGYRRKSLGDSVSLAR